MKIEPIRFPALDGRLLGGTWYLPEGPPSAAVLIAPAFGVAQPYYARFATHLAGAGIAVLTFDPRGLGASRDRPLAGDPATLSEWAQCDVGAGVDLLADRFPGVPTAGVGHSFGGQAWGITARSRDLDRVVIVAAGLGDLRIYPPLHAWAFRAVLQGVVPVVSGVRGYVPGWLGIGADLPAGVVAEWARWCATPGYVYGALGEAHTHFHRVEAPLLFVEAPGDVYAPPTAAAALRALYRRAPLTLRQVGADELPPRAQGHFGLFRAEGAPVWEEIIRFLGGRAELQAAK